MNVYDCGNELARAIRDSHEFKKIKEAKGSLDAQGKELTDKFLRLNMEAQIAQSQGKEPEQKLTDEIQEIYKILSLNSNAMDYLNAYMRFTMMMNDIMKNIQDAVQEATE